MLKRSDVKLENMEITFLGTSTSAPTKTRNHPGIHVKFLSHNFMLDCGEGTQRQMILAGISPYKVSQIFIIAGLIALLISLALVLIGIAMPPSSIYENNDAYKTVFSNSIRVIIASIVAFLISQHHDIYAFNFWKKKTKGKWLWLRNNLSTGVSQLIDTSIFVLIAFYKVTPDFTADRMLAMILPYWLLKIIFAVADTPFVYLGVKWLRSDSRKSLADSED